MISRYSAHWCKACSTYFAVDLHRDATGDYILHCPRCRREHPRRMVNGLAVSCDPPRGEAIHKRNCFTITEADAREMHEGEKVIELQDAARRQVGKRPRQMTQEELEALPIVTNKGHMADGFYIPPFDPDFDVRVDDIGGFRDKDRRYWSIERQHGAWCRRSREARA